MAADLTADDLLSPAGRLIPRVHFPGQSLKAIKAKLAKFIELAKVEGEDLADVRLFCKVRGYERAFDEVYQRLIVVAADVAVEEGRRAFAKEQMDKVGAERDKYDALAQDMLDAVAAPIAPYPVTVESRSIPIRRTDPGMPFERRPCSEAEARRWLGR